MELRVTATGLSITLDDGGVYAGIRYANGQLITSSGRALVALGPKGRAKVEAALAEVQPAVYETAIGDAAKGEGWEFDGVRHGVLGVYRRLVSPAINRTVTF